MSWAKKEKCKPKPAHEKRETTTKEEDNPNNSLNDKSIKLLVEKTLKDYQDENDI
jgi:hypothetical protein